MANRYSQPMIFQAPLQMYEEQVFEPDYGVLQQSLSMLDQRYSAAKDLNKAFSPEYLAFKDHKEKAAQLETEMDNKFVSVAEAYKRSVVEGNRAMAAFTSEMKRELTNPNSKYNTLKTLKTEYQQNIAAIAERYEKDGAGAAANRYVAQKTVTESFNKEFSSFFDEEGGKRIGTPGDLSSQFVGYTDVTKKLIDTLKNMKEDEIEQFMQSMNLQGTDIIYTITEGGLSQEKIRQAAALLLGEDADIQAQLGVEAEYRVDLFGGEEEYIKSKSSIINSSSQQIISEIEGYKTLKDEDEIKAIQAQLGVKVTGKMNEDTIKALDNMIRETEQEAANSINELTKDPVNFEKQIKESNLTNTAISVLYNIKRKIDFKIDNTRQIKERNQIEQLKLEEMRKATQSDVVVTDEGGQINAESAAELLYSAEESMQSVRSNLRETLQDIIPTSMSNGKAGKGVDVIAKVLGEAKSQKEAVQGLVAAGISEADANTLYKTYVSDTDYADALRSGVSSYVTALETVNQYSDRAYTGMIDMYNSDEDFKAIVDEVEGYGLSRSEAYRYLAAVSKKPNKRTDAENKFVSQIDKKIDAQIIASSGKSGSAPVAGGSSIADQSAAAATRSLFMNRVKKLKVPELFKGELVAVPTISATVVNSDEVKIGTERLIQHMLEGNGSVTVKKKNGKYVTDANASQVTGAINKLENPTITYAVNTDGNKPYFVLTYTGKKGGVVEVTGSMDHVATGAINTTIGTIIQPYIRRYTELMQRSTDGSLSEVELSELTSLSKTISSLARATGNSPNGSAYVSLATASDLAKENTIYAEKGSIYYEKTANGEAFTVDVVAPTGEVITYVRGGKGDTTFKQGKSVITSKNLRYYPIDKKTGEPDTTSGITQDHMKRLLHNIDAVTVGGSTQYREVNVKGLQGRSLN